MTAPASRPRAVTIAFWAWLVASVLLMFGGLLITSTGTDVPGVIRGAGVICVLAGGAIGFLAGRLRKPDPRWWRAAVALSLTTILLVSLMSVMVVIHLFTVLALLALVVGAVLITRTSAREYFGA